MTGLVIWGASGHARVVTDIIRTAGRYQIVGYLDDDPDRAGSDFCGSVVLGGRDELAKLLTLDVRHMIVAVGDSAARAALASLAVSAGFELVRAIHPRAVVAADALIGEGTVVCAGAVIGPATTVGKNVIINTSASVDHDCVIADCAHVGPGAHLAGGVSVGRQSMIGVGTAVRDHVSIGAETTIGAGSAVVSDIPDGVVAYGVPARMARRSKLQKAALPRLLTSKAPPGGVRPGFWHRICSL